MDAKNANLIGFYEEKIKYVHGGINLINIGFIEWLLVLAKEV